MVAQVIEVIRSIRNPVGGEVVIWPYELLILFIAGGHFRRHLPRMLRIIYDYYIISIRYIYIYFFFSYDA